MTHASLLSPGDPLTALALLTRLPIPGARFDRSARAAWAWPLAGLVTGSIAALVVAGSGALGLPSPAAAGLGLGAIAFATGAMHEDGLADSVDGLWGGWDRERRLAIMKDSLIGTYGVLALIFVTGLRWIALTTLVEAGAAGVALLAAGTLSRAAMLPVATLLPHARTTGLSVSTGRPPRATCLAGIAMAAVFALLLLGLPAIMALMVAALAALAVAVLARSRIGGQTGDILGATQQLAEVSVLLALVALA